MKPFLFDGICLKNKRSSNMDSLLLKNVTVDNHDGLLAVVCDGVGSMADGAFASANAIRMLDEWFGALETTERIGLRLRDNVIKINTHIAIAAKAKRLDCATTLSALLLLGDFYYIVHIGDSRIYSFDGISLTMLTVDDISQSGKLTTCVGRYEDIAPHYSEGSVDGKKFLICSDGMYKKIDFDFLLSQMDFNNRREIRKAIKNIVEYVITHGENDNISIALVKTES